MKYEIKAQADGQSADIYINDFIGDWIDDYWGLGVTSKSFIRELQDLPESVKTVRLHINSPGGDVVSATHIANTIRDQQAHRGRVFEGLIEGAAWSAATIITSATKPTKIADNALMMAHNPWTITLGNASELRKAAETMDKYRDSMVAAYQWKSPLSAEDLIALMDAETWMDANDAITNGFADEKIAGVSAAAFIDEKYFAKLPKIPEQYQARVQALLKPAQSAQPQTDQPAPTTTDAPPLEKGGTGGFDIIDVTPEVIRAEAAAIVKLCNEHGLPEMAAEFLAKGTRQSDVEKRFAHAGEIKARCAAANMKDRAAKFIGADMTPDEVSAALIKITQASDPGEIDNTVRPETTAANGNGKPTLDVRAINARYREKESIYRRKS